MKNTKKRAIIEEVDSEDLTDNEPTHHTTSAPQKRSLQIRGEFENDRSKLEKDKAQDTVDRYKFLLGQTELFSHFINSKGASGPTSLRLSFLDCFCF